MTTTTMTTREQRLAQHVTDLAAAFKVVVQVVRNATEPVGGAHWDERDLHLPIPERRFRIRISPVVCEATYAVAMHELGHCLSPLGFLTPVLGSTPNAHVAPSTLRDVRLVLEQEQAAGDWARHYTLGNEWTAAMQQVESICLEGYYKNARRFGVRA